MCVNIYCERRPECCRAYTAAVCASVGAHTAVYKCVTGFCCLSYGWILKDIGKSKIIWSAAPIEMSKPYMSRQVFFRIIQALIKKPVFTSNAPKFVEILSWEKDGKDYLAAVNEQEESPIAPMYDIYIDVKNQGKRAYLLPSGEEIKTEMIGEDTMRICLPKLEVFQMIELS